MNAPLITDAAMPGLATALSPGALARDLSDAVSAATSGEWSIPELDIVRVRYRRGRRAILQVDLALEGPQGPMRAPGSVWFFAGDKAAKQVASASPTQRWQLPEVFLEPRRKCLVSIFPHDRHVPQIAAFLASPGDFASDLLGARVFSAPRLVRYRPGIGATFRWQGDKGTRYVKIHGDRPPARLAASVRGIAAALGPVVVPEPLGIAEEIAAVSYGEVEGPFLDGVLAGGDVDHIRDASERTADAMHILHGAGLDARRANSRARFIEKAEDSALLIAALSPDLGANALSICRRLQQENPPLSLASVHGDLKLEHVAVQPGRIGFLDIESIDLCDPLYDLAMLDARVVGYEAEGRCSPIAAEACRKTLAGSYLERPGPRTAERFRWLRAVAALWVARHYAQGLAAGWEGRVRTILDTAWDGLSDIADC